MDPAANLAEQLQAVERLLTFGDQCREDRTGSDWTDLANDAIRLAELVQALDVWIRKGGFLPEAWVHARGRAAVESEPPADVIRAILPAKDRKLIGDLLRIRGRDKARVARSAWSDRTYEQWTREARHYDELADLFVA